MTKSKRARVQHQHQDANNTGHGAGKKHRKMSSFVKLSTKSNNYNSGSNNTRARKKDDAQQQQQQQQKQQHQQHRKPIVPFRRRDRILLVGEGDFSFARSLATYHRCKNLVATCYDSQEALYAKYPQAEKNVADIISSSSSTRIRKPENGEHQDGNKAPKVLFSVDAKKLGAPSGGGKDIRIGFPRRERKRPAWEKEHKDGHKGNEKRKAAGGGFGGPWDMICFNFPHVGGLSTDVNRQVRANQELLVAFFKACVPLLASRVEAHEGEDDWDEPSTDVGSDDDGSEGESDDGADCTDDGIVRAKDEWRTEPGQLLVTLFEGEPYTLWNIRDLARHAGLRVVTSFKFPWACYRGYSHARTLGEIEGKDGGRGGWRGEDREARMYMFEVKTDDHTMSSGTTGKRKKRPAESDDSDSD